jgi:HK97 family phage portal protein
VERVTETSALSLSTYWACVSTIADDLASVPWRVMEKVRPAGRRFADEHGVDWLLHVQPNPEMTAFTFRQTLFQWALTWGNGVAEIERDGANRPVWLWPIEPWRVRPERDMAGRLVYEVSNFGRPATILDAADVLHVKGLGDGVWGYSVLEFAARTLGVALTADRRAARGFANDGRPGGVIERQGKLSDPARERYRRDWKAIHNGNPGEIAILEEGDKFTPIAPTSPQDAQLIESRKFSAEDVCRYFKMPPPKVGLLDRATFSNIEHQSIMYVVGTLVPWAVRTEQEANLKLFGAKQRGTYYTRLFFQGLMRGDSKSRAEYFAIMVERGLMSPDEARELDEMDPIPHGNTHFVPVNWQTLERAVNPPEPQPALPPPAGNTPPAEPTPTDAPEGD